MASEFVSLATPKDHPKWWYGVYRGHTPGVYTEWSDVVEQTSGYAKCVVKKCDSEDLAHCFVIYGPDGPSTRHGGSSVTESTWVTASSASSATAEAVSHGCAQARVYDARIEFRVTLEPKPGTGIRITRTHSLGNPYAAPVNPFSAATSTSGTGGPCSSALPLPTVTTVCIPVVPSHILAMGLDFVMLYGLIQTLEMYLRHEIPHRLCQGLHQEHVILLVGRLHAYNIVTRYLDKWYIEDKLFSQVKVGATVLRSVHMLLEMLPQRNMVQIRYGV